MTVIEPRRLSGGLICSAVFFVSATAPSSLRNRAKSAVVLGPKIKNIRAYVLIDVMLRFGYGTETELDALQF